MKILYIILDHHSAKDLSVACQQTWMKDVSSNDEILFIGDPLMPDFICGNEVYKPLLDEPEVCQHRITEKMVKTFNYIAEKDWDFVLRIDVDAYCNINNLENLLKQLDKGADHYYGQGLYFLREKHPCFISNIGDSIPPKKYKYYYAQGGCYLISKSALMKGLPHMYYPAPIEARAEDIMVGDALSKGGVRLTDRPDLFCCGYIGKGFHIPDVRTRRVSKNEHIDNITKKGFVSTHKICHHTIKEIHKKLNN